MPDSIDMNTFNALKEATGDDFIIELIDTFLADAPDLIAQMKTALANNDIETFRRAAHSMKSNAATFGAAELSNLAKELEGIARENSLNIDDKLDLLEEAYHRAETDLRSLK